MPNTNTQTAQQQNNPELSRFYSVRFRILFGLGIAALVIGLWASCEYFLVHFRGINDLVSRGQFGDQFGTVNSLFAGLALAGVIYTIFLQTLELASHRIELRRQAEQHENTIKLTASAMELTAKMFKRQHVIDLHMAWKDIKHIDPAAPVAVDVVRGVNALGLTATLWNHDIIEREILFTSYWPGFQALYDSLATCTVVLPTVNKMGKDCLTNEIKRAYNEMKVAETAALNRSVTQTTIN